MPRLLSRSNSYLSNSQSEKPNESVKAMAWGRISMQTSLIALRISEAISLSGVVFWMRPNWQRSTRADSAVVSRYCRIDDMISN